MREKLMKARSKKSGLPPGTAVYIGERKAGKTRVRMMSYSPGAVEEREIADPRGLKKEEGKITWINIDGVNDAPVLERIGEAFSLHPLVIEDIANTDQRPKVEDYGSYLYIVVRMFDHAPDGVYSEQMSIVLGRDFVLSFQEAEGDVFDAVRQRIRSGTGSLRKEGPDYLAYALLDAVVDDYFSLLETAGDEIESMEERLVSDPSPKVLRDIHHLKTEMIVLRKSVWPLREVISYLEKTDSKLIRPGTKTYLRDVYDHTIHVIDSVETFRDMVSGMLDIYLSSVSNRLNEVMKFLTVIGTIFLPLTFIAGVYGMNFRYMPELEQPLGYFAVWAVMIIVAAVMMFYFRGRKWI